MNNYEKISNDIKVMKIEPAQYHEYGLELNVPENIKFYKIIIDDIGGPELETRYGSRENTRKIADKIKTEWILKTVTTGIMIIASVYAGARIGKVISEYRPVKVYEFSMNGKELGIVQNPENVYKVLNVINDNFKKQNNMNLIDNIPKFKQIGISKNKINKNQNIENLIENNINNKVMASVIIADGKIIGTTKSKEDSEWVLNQILLPYKKENTSQAAFVQDVKISEHPADYNTIEPKEDTYKKIAFGTDQNDYYTVQQSDTIWNIAKKFKITIEDIKKANPEFASSGSVYTGMKLNMVVPHNQLNVGVVQKITTQQDIQFDTQTKTDGSMYKNQKKTIQQGVKGIKETVYNVVSIDGTEKSREVLTENITKEPVKEIVLQGTKSLPYTIGTFRLPVSGQISSRFGMRWGRMHNGVDIAVPYGTPIYASNSGSIIFSGYMSGYGNLIEIDHGAGITTRYGHCSKLVVKLGQKVGKGQLIALAGSTGNSTGPHVHFEFRVDGKPVDPLNKAN